MLSAPEPVQGSPSAGPEPGARASAARHEGHADGGQGDLDDELDPVDPVGVADAQGLGDHATDEGGDDADGDRDPDGDVLAPRDDESTEGTHDEPDDDRRDDHA